MTAIDRDPRGRKTSKIVESLRGLDVGECIFIESDRRDYVRNFLISASGSSKSKSKFKHLSFSESKSHIGIGAGMYTKGYYLTRVEGKKLSKQEKIELKNNRVLVETFFLKD